MKLLFILFFTASSFLSNTDSIQYGRFISIKEAPYFVSLFFPFNCGGVIISEYWTVTASHCVATWRGYVAKGVLTGEDIYHDDDENWHELVYWFEKIIVYGDYTFANDASINDVALIKLQKPIKFDEYHQPIKIRKIPPRENETVVVMGLGLQGNARRSAPVLKQTEIAVVNETHCDFQNVTSGIQNIVFCAGNGNPGHCKGDSGSSAVIDGQLAGLVSFGSTCTNYTNRVDSPGKYVRLDAFYDWIMKITGIVY